MRIDPSDPELIVLLNRATLTGRMLRGAAHELNNVLQTIRGSAELLAGRPDLPPELLPRITAITSQAVRATTIVAAAAAMASRTEPAPATVDVAAAVRRVIERRGFETRRAAIHVEQESGDGTHLVKAVPEQIDQMLLNLLINAEQAVAGATERRILVRTSSDGAAVQVSVSDTGVGFAPDLHELAFDPYVAGWSAERSAGLGLTATRVLARRYGGALSSAARTGGGATMTLTLPRVA
jgi:two-component system NtrC family sensor kinase